MMAHDQMMADMGMAMDMPWTRGDVMFAFVMWSVMMVGMMPPSAAPVMLLFAGAQRGARQTRRQCACRCSALGYLLVWVGFSVVAALAQWALHEAAMLSPAMSMSSAAPRRRDPDRRRYLSTDANQGRVPQALSNAAGVSDVALARRRGRRARHGAEAWRVLPRLLLGADDVLFVVGVMNLVWVAALTIFVLVEKLGPAGVVIARVAGVAMIVAGGVVVFNA